MDSVILRTEKLCKSFSNGGMQQHVIRNLDLEIREGDFTVIMGASGSGKSTLLYALSGMDMPTLGKVFFGNEEISAYSHDRLAVFRRNHCGFVFQNIYLMDNMNVMDNILTGALLIQKPSEQLTAKIEKLLEQFDIGKELWTKFPNQLSGGECQRIGIIRAIINDPQILFADEPTGSLNSASGQAVLDVMSDIHRNGQSIVMVTHDLKTALRGTRVIYLRDGAVSGEYAMQPFGSDDLQTRRNGLQQFLDQMGW